MSFLDTVSTCEVIKLILYDCGFLYMDYMGGKME